MNCLTNTKQSEATSALFVSDAAYLKESLGGVQICTQEYINTLKASGFALSLFRYTPETRLLTRIRRKLFPRPYTDRLPINLAKDIAAYVKENNIDVVFLNQVDTASIAQYLRGEVGEQCKIILLSHGLESTDIFHSIRTKNDSQAFSQANSNDLRFLAQSLVSEHQHRQYIDYIFCLSAFEAEIERWLGAKNVAWLPRTIPSNPLAWNPDYSHLGFVGTLDHTPNREGLLLFLQAFQAVVPNSAKVRLVGGPEKVGKRIAQQFPCVEYLGRLSNEELEKEASTWSCLVHPLFCYSRGCSTKLAIALGWQIPIITTPAGCRGYTWEKGSIPLAETPELLAELALKMLNPEMANTVQREVSEIAKSAPTLNDVAAKFQTCLSPFIKVIL